ncbi:MAG: hypothetical protein KKC42_00815 [Candidatus Omnitrophica bacterium]|nr:hypothetical protein [Candidatus Omnitrophota bacterium]
MIVITKEQKKILYIAVGVFVFMASFWVFIYIPQSRRLVSLKEELKNVQSQIEEINALAQGRELTEAAENFNRQFAKVSSFLISEDEDVISYLSEQARELKIAVSNISPGGRKPLDKQVVGYDIEELPISMNLICEYKQLGEYLDILKKSYSVLVSLRELNIKGKGEGRYFLDVGLKLSAYLAKQR